MGDWGTESGQPYDPDTWSRPAHKVTLDGFSMMAYKVTYEDFDIFIDGTGNERIDMDEFSIEDRAPRWCPQKWCTRSDSRGAGSPIS
jgi:formylglycine-generating enzyme required for sulfatase activity